MPGVIQSFFQKLKPGKRQKKPLFKDMESGTNIFNTVSKTQLIKRKKELRAKQVNEAIRGFFIATLFLALGTLMIMYFSEF
jgi:hypothetical protein